MKLAIKSIQHQMQTIVLLSLININAQMSSRHVQLFKTCINYFRTEKASIKRNSKNRHTINILYTNVVFGVITHR